MKQFFCVLLCILLLCTLTIGAAAADTEDIVVLEEDTLTVTDEAVSGEETLTITDEAVSDTGEADWIWFVIAAVIVIAVGAVILLVRRKPANA